MARLQIENSHTGVGAPPLSPAFGDRVGAQGLYAALDRDFPYSALDTCATDGLCATACPVSIDTGKRVKRFRQMRQTPATQKWAVRIAGHFSAAEVVVRSALRMGHAAQALIGLAGVRAVSRMMKSVLGDNMAEWTPDMPHAAEGVPRTSRSGAQAVYFPSCISRMMGRLPGEPQDRSLMEVVLELG